MQVCFFSSYIPRALLTQKQLEEQREKDRVYMKTFRTKKKPIDQFQMSPDLHGNQHIVIETNRHPGDQMFLTSAMEFNHNIEFNQRIVNNIEYLNGDNAVFVDTGDQIGELGDMENDQGIPMGTMIVERNENGEDENENTVNNVSGFVIGGYGMGGPESNMLLSGSQIKLEVETDGEEAGEIDHVVEQSKKFINVSDVNAEINTASSHEINNDVGSTGEVCVNHVGNQENENDTDDVAKDLEGWKGMNNDVLDTHVGTSDEITSFTIEVANEQSEMR